MNPDSNKHADEVFSMFSLKNLSDLGSDKEILFFTLNRGATVRLFDNSYHSEQLHRMGLTPETAFGCAIDFLFQPVPAIIDTIKPLLQTLRHATTIGIHIRVGDHVFQGTDETDIGKYNSFFECAQQIESRMLTANNVQEGHLNANDQQPAKRVKWLLFSDSIKLRQRACEIYGDKVHVMPGMQVQHSYGQHGVHEKATATKRGFLNAATEHWLLGLTDVHVIDSYSGFGLSGAMRTYIDGKAFSIISGQEDRCHRDQYLRVKEAGSLHSGI